MGQTGTTLAFIAVAVLLCLAAVTLRPGTAQDTDFSDQGELFYPGFTDMTECRELEIRMADRTTGAVRNLELRFADEGGWRATTHEDFPADMFTSIQRLSAFVGLTKSVVVSDESTSHRLYGVVDPSAQRGAPPADVGRHYTFKDRNRRIIAEYIIGKPVVRDGATGFVYARVPGHDRVYETQLDLTMTYPPGTNNWLDADLTDWIDIDPMKFSQQQIMRIRLNRYDVEEQPVFPGAPSFGERISVINREVVDLEFDKDSRKWQVAGTNPETEHVDQEVAKAIAHAIDTLTVEGATRKHPTMQEWMDKGEVAPVVAASELPAPKSTGNQPGQRIYWATGGNGLNTGFLLEEHSKRIFSNLGEVIMELDSGLRYTLRIGEVTVSTESKPGETDEEAVSAEARALRYVVLEVDWDDALMPEPVAPVKPAILIEEEEREAREKAAQEAQPAEPESNPEGSTPEQPSDQEAPIGPVAPDTPAAEPTETNVDAPVPDPEREERIRVARNEYSQAESKYKRDREKWLRDVENNKKRMTELQDRYRDWVFLFPESLMADVQKSRADIVKPKPTAPVQPGPVEVPAGG